jgi:hypothetical protein
MFVFCNQKKPLVEPVAKCTSSTFGLGKSRPAEGTTRAPSVRDITGQRAPS